MCVCARARRRGVLSCPLTLGGRPGSQQGNLSRFIALEANVCKAVLIFDVFPLKLKDTHQQQAFVLDKYVTFTFPHYFPSIMVIRKTFQYLAS